jgi:hypothetical protein
MHHHILNYEYKTYIPVAQNHQSDAANLYSLSLVQAPHQQQEVDETYGENLEETTAYQYSIISSPSVLNGSGQPRITKQMEDPIACIRKS